MYRKDVSEMPIEKRKSNRLYIITDNCRMWAKEKLYSGESADGSEWDSVYLKLYGQCGKAPQFAKELLKDLEAAVYQMRIIKEYNACHDYKKSDGDIIRSIPEILSADISALG